jgi:hypothetical protein
VSNQRDNAQSDALKLSVLVVAHDEGHQLADCLTSLAFADEIVVVLDRCTDDSRDVALRFTDHIVEGAWPVEGPRRHAGIDACSGDWILEVDADERASQELGDEIRRTIATAAPGYFLVPFDNYIGARRVRYGWGGSWGVMAAPRLFTPGAKQWGAQRIHPSLKLDGPKRRLTTPMEHYVDKDLADMMARLQRYTDAKAADMRASGERLPPLWWVFRRCISRFIKCWVFRKGYREGRWGFVIAVMAALYPLLSHLKAELDDPEQGEGRG